MGEHPIKKDDEVTILVIQEFVRGFDSGDMGKRPFLKIASYEKDRNNEIEEL